MAKEIHKSGLPKQPPDISQILLDAQNRWLRPTEICEILWNYKSFRIAPEPPNRPLSGSLFLFDRKIMRYFRKDEHNWRKKKDRKTVREAHERLKVGSIVLHVYYAHGEENENFQRRTCSLLEEDFIDIVLVHYLEVQGCNQSFSRTKEAEEITGLSIVHNPTCSNSFASQSEVANLTMDTESPISEQFSEYEDAETDNSLASSIYHPFVEIQQSVDGAMMDGLLGALAPSSSVNCLGCMFNEVGAGLRSDSKTMLDPMQFDESFLEYSTGFLEPALHSSVATIEFRNVDHSCCLETRMSKAQYTDNLTQKEAGAPSAAGMPSSQVLNFLP